MATEIANFSLYRF